MRKQPLTPLSEKIIATIKRVPRGKVTSYGEIAKRAGNPGASRAVAWLLHSASKRYALPWHRIINAQGKIAFHPMSSGFAAQKSLLEREGIEVTRSGHVDMKKYGWKSTRR